MRLADSEKNQVEVKVEVEENRSLLNLSLLFANS